MSPSYGSHPAAAAASSSAARSINTVALSAFAARFRCSSSAPLFAALRALPWPIPFDPARCSAITTAALFLVPSPLEDLTNGSSIVDFHGQVHIATVATAAQRPLLDWRISSWPPPPLPPLFPSPSLLLLLLLLLLQRSCRCLRITTLPPLSSLRRMRKATRALLESPACSTVFDSSSTFP